VKVTDLKYLLAYIIPCLGIMCAYDPQRYYLLVPIFGYVMVPVLEFIIPPNNINFEASEESSRLANRFFDILLYLNFPLIFILLGWGLWSLTTIELTTTQLVFSIFSFGIVFSVSGLNVAHEIGHRSHQFNQIVSQVMLIPSLYMHFNIEHNLGHHKHVATPVDPATSKKGEWVYLFFFRSIIGQYLSAWQIENKTVSKKYGQAFHFSNKMIHFHLIQAAFLICLYLLFGGIGVLYFLPIALISVLHLEAINYIEHYGLNRQKLDSGRYEPIQAKHSWNSDHVVGRILLYELTRHSDHHFKSTRRYQTLRSMEEGPNLILGYPGSILLSLVPPLWMAIMDKHVPEQG